MIFSHFIRYTCKARPVQFISRKNLSEHAVTATSISNPNLHNFHDVLLEKVSNIIINIAENTPSRILHIWPENNLTTFLAKGKIFSMEGLSDATGADREFIEKKRYGAIEYVDFSSDEPYPFLGGFQVIVSCAPPLYTFADRNRIPPLHQLSRLLNYQGFALIGGSEDFWQGADLTQVLTEEAENPNGELDFMTMQTLDFEVTPKGDSRAVPITYYLAVLQRR